MIASMLVEAATFLLEHADLLELIDTAFKRGVTKETVMAGIRVAMVTASDEVMKKELG